MLAFKRRRRDTDGRGQQHKEPARPSGDFRDLLSHPRTDAARVFIQHAFVQWTSQSVSGIMAKITHLVVRSISRKHVAACLAFLLQPLHLGTLGTVIFSENVTIVTI